MIYSLILISPLLFSTVHAANDWSVPCFQGECSYDLPKAKGVQPSATGTIRIWGSENAIADVTAAGGWEIIGCSPTALSQDIRIVCKSDDAESACNHLFENGGAVNKIVRLPENCGANAFARIARAWVPDDQTLPTEIAAKIVRRDGVPPEVQALSVDTNFSAVDATANGPVNIAIQAMNAPGFENTLQTAPIARRRTRRRSSARNSKRGIFDVFEDAIDFVVDTLKSFTTFDVEESAQLPPIEVNESFDLINESIDCGAVKATLKASVNAKARAVVDIGIVAIGSIVPPKLDNFNAFTGLTADLDGTLSIVADAIGELSTPEITLFEAGIPGLSFPGILQVGPAFKINALAKATLDVKLDMEVGLNYKIANTRLVFPPNDKQNSEGTFNIADTPLKISVSPSVEAKGTLEAHLIPQVDIGLDAFDTIKATVFLNLDAAAILELSLQAGANIGVNVSKRSITPSTEGVGMLAEEEHARPMGETESLMLPPRTFPRRHLAVLDVRSPAPNALNSRQLVVSDSVDTFFGGCVALKAGLSVNAGADAEFLGLFDAGTAVALFKREFELFKKCFGDAPAVARRTVLPPYSPIVASRQLSGLICAAPEIANAVSVADGNVKAQEIKEI